MKVSVVFEPDPELGPDPKDESGRPRRIGEFLDSEKMDILLAWREIGDQYEGGAITYIISSGVWENISSDQIEDILTRLRDLD